MRPLRRLKMSLLAQERPVISFHIKGGMGDHLMAARFIRDFVAHVGDMEFDVYTRRPKVAEWIFNGMPNLRAVKYLAPEDEHFEDARYQYT